MRLPTISHILGPVLCAWQVQGLCFASPIISRLQGQCHGMIAFARTCRARKAPPLLLRGGGRGRGGEPLTAPGARSGRRLRLRLESACPRGV